MVCPMYEMLDENRLANPPLQHADILRRCQQSSLCNKFTLVAVAA